MPWKKQPTAKLSQDQTEIDAVLAMDIGLYLLFKAIHEQIIFSIYFLKGSG